MQRDKERVPAGVGFDRTGAPQPRGVAGGPGELGQPLRGDENEGAVERRQRLSSTRKPAVKPGPSAFSSAKLHGAASASISSSTNITVAADMLP